MTTMFTTPTTPVPTAGRAAAAPAPRVDQARYIVGTALTAGVAVLTALLGVVVARGILHLHVFTTGSGPQALPYALGVAGIAVLAGLLFDGALHVAPHPTAYFGALVALGTALAVAVPFASGASLPVQTAVALTNLVVGAVIGLLIPLAAGTARR